MNSTTTLNPPSIAGFDRIKRYWDNANNMVAAKLLPGEYYVTSQDELITTVLGSRIAACVRDKVSGIGGMNHFMLPETSKARLDEGRESVVGNSTRYGNYAMEHLINTILANGGKRKNLEVKVFGGGKIIPTMGDVGLRNIGFVLDYIDTEGLTLLSQDLGDIYPRKVNFYPKTGKVRMKKIQDLHNDTIIQRETQYRRLIKNAPVESEIELF
jgi:chemotaxis protein CheD